MSNFSKDVSNTSLHYPVMLDEVINYMDIQKDRIYVDCTLGLGGHSYEILKKLNGTGMLIGLERDEETLQLAKDRLKDFKNCYLFHSNFLDIRSILHNLNIDKITGGILMDLGINSLQLDTADRGFSIKNNSLLDMRMDKNQILTAQKVINTYKESELADIIYYFGEERYARKIARFIKETRQKTVLLKPHRN